LQSNHQQLNDPVQVYDPQQSFHMQIGSAETASAGSTTNFIAVSPPFFASILTVGVMGNSLQRCYNAM
jgi:hypothetical protein